MSLLAEYSLFTNVTGTNVTASASPGVVLLGANPQRKALIVFNNSPNPLLIKFAQKLSGSFAPPSITTSDFTTQITSSAQFQIGAPCPTGSLLGVWPGGASGSAMITEIS